MSRGSVARFLRSELGLIFRRRRNQALLVVLAALPVMIAVAIKVTADDRAHGQSDSLFAGITDNGIFVAFAALEAVLTLFLPIAVAVVSGDAVAGEAGSGTLRYLLAVPVGRTRLLVVKYVATLVWCLACLMVVVGVGTLIGWALFGAGDVTLLSGITVGLPEALWRLLWVVAYLTVMLAAVAAIGLFVSTLTEVPVAAMAATLVVVIASEVLDAVPQLHALRPWLFSHYWLRFADILRDPVPVAELRHGCVVALAYVAIFVSAAWARFGGKDITS